MNCSICVSQVASLVSCYSCQFEACRSCIQTYIAESEKIQCMNCRAQFNQKFMRMNLDQLYVRELYTKLKIKEQMDYVKVEIPLAPLFLRKKMLSKEIDAKKRAFWDIMPKHCKRNQYHTYRYDDPTVDLVAIDDEKQINTIKILGKEIHAQNVEILNLGREIKNQKQRLRYQAQSPSSKYNCVNCKNGFVTGDDETCGLCKNTTCLKCMKAGGINHECIQEDVDSVFEMMRTSKKCPSCLTFISKIEGCNHMFCTECKTPFNWISGEIIKHTFFHNPHYTAYLDNGGVRIFRDAECDDELMTLVEWPDQIEGVTDQSDYDTLYEIYEFSKDLINEYNTTFAAEFESYSVYDDLRKKYLMNSNEEKFVSSVSKRYRRFTKYEAMNDMCIVTIRIVTDLLNAIVEGNISVSEGIDAYFTTVLFFEKEYRKINKQLSMVFESDYMFTSIL